MSPIPLIGGVLHEDIVYQRGHLVRIYSSIFIMWRKTGYSKQSLGIRIITDGKPEGQRAKIEALNLEQYVDYIIVTDELGGIEYRKPNEKAFVLMKERFGVKYYEMCYIGDNTKKDFIAPKILGMKSILFINFDGLYCQAE